jgi:hypothetical protein
VIAKSLERGIEVTALHNQFLRATPVVWSTHISGHGDPAKMGAQIRAALGLSKTPFDPPPAVCFRPSY